MIGSRPIVVVTAALLLGACDGRPSVDEGLKRDLDAAAAGAIELAPQGGTRIVTAAEIVPQAKPVVTKTRRVEAPARTPTPRIPQESPRTSEPAATRPVSTPKVSPPPPGGYKTVDEVIRNAPFPIKP